jgi:hypothetical protein
LGPLADARATPKYFPSPSSPPSARAVALCDADEAQTSVPADAPCRSPEPARPGGSFRQSADQPRRQPARVTRSSTLQAQSKTDSGIAYFFFRRFFVFFAAAFAFLFFAIAALLA